jgi:DNA polymerase III subunit epsilon
MYLCVLGGRLSDPARTVDWMPSDGGRIIVFDVETTGTDKRRDQVIEFCAQLGLDERAESRVLRLRPSVSISPGAQAVHGITMEDLADCPPFAACADEIRRLVESADVLVGYNLGFDIEMLQAEYERLGERPLALEGKRVVDPFRLWQSCEPRTLQHAHRRFVGGDFAEAHSAAADVSATGRVLLGMLSAFGLGGQGWDQIADVCEPGRASWVGPSRHVQWSEDGVPVLGFGKHGGKPIHELAQSADAGYLRWIMGKDFPGHVREICGRALELPPGDFLDWIGLEYGAGALDKAS